MAQVINLDSGAYVQDALGRRVIDLDFALAQVRADAEKIWVKDPRAKKGGYYRTIKGGAGKGKGRIGATTPAIRKAVVKGTAAGLGVTALGGLAAAAALRGRSEKKTQDIKNAAKEKAASTNPATGKPYDQPSAQKGSQGSGGKLSKAEETMSDIKATNAKSKDMLDKTQAKIEERKRKKQQGN